MSRDRLDLLLEASNPLERTTLETDAVERALDGIGASITSRSRRARRRGISRRRAIVLIGAAVVATGAGVAAGAVLTAHTGLFPSKAEQAMGGPGEALNPGAPDFRPVALQVASDIPYPAGYEGWRDFLISREIRFAYGGLESTGALHGWFAASAFCAWLQSWRAAVVAGDASATALGAQRIAQAPGWKAVTDEDPHPSPTAANDPGAEKGTLFGWLLPYRDAVQAGDRARVEHLLAAGYGDGKCWSSDPAWMAQERAWRSLSPGQLARKYLRFLASGRS